MAAIDFQLYRSLGGHKRSCDLLLGILCSTNSLFILLANVIIVLLHYVLFQMLDSGRSCLLWSLVEAAELICNGLCHAYVLGASVPSCSL